MALLVTGFIMLIIVIIAVKIFDDEIRPYHWKKVLVNCCTVAGLVFMVIGFIQTILMRG